MAKILIIDDDEALRSALQLRFETDAFVVAAFAAAEDALATATDAGCFVLDLKLPGMSGLDFLRIMRQRGVAAPAILITSAPSVATRELAVASDAVVVEKPLLGDAIVQVVRRALA